MTFSKSNEISAAVVSALKVRLVKTGDSLGARQTTVLEAHDEYLIGRDFLWRRDLDSARTAVAAFRRAVELDPQYAAAYAALSEAEILANDWAGTLNADNLASIFSNADKAIALRPDLADGYSERSMLRLQIKGNLHGALADISEALRLDPASSTNLRRAGFVHRCLGNLEVATTFGMSATRADPLDMFAWLHLGLTYTSARRYTEANDAFARLFALNPKADGGAREASLELLALQGRGQELKKEAAQIAEPVERAYFATIAESVSGRSQIAQRSIDDFIRRFGNDRPELVAELWAYQHAPRQALDWLETAANRTLGNVSCLLSDPALSDLRDDPRFKAIVVRLTEASS